MSSNDVCSSSTHVMQSSLPKVIIGLSQNADVIKVGNNIQGMLCLSW